MFVLLLSCFSTLFLLKSLSLKPIVTAEYWKLSSSCLRWFQKDRAPSIFFRAPRTMHQKQASSSLKERDQTWEEDQQEDENSCLLDLPDLALDTVLGKLSPVDLCSLAAACSYLRERCTSDHLWEKHLKQKWGGVMSDASFREWQSNVDSSNTRSSFGNIENGGKGLLGSLYNVWPFSWFRPKLDVRSKSRRTYLPVDSVMALYLSLECGKFWFPAQVYNRQNGHIGFMLSCYDAKLSYDAQTNTFFARYSPNGRRTIEESVPWERLRVPAVDTPAHTLHVSDCLAELKPGDHVEVQWRKTKEFPYGWWYAVIGHLESCDGNQEHCHCQYSDKIVVEFNQYNHSSRWRQTVIDRKGHTEEGNEVDGFYGGIRKLYKEDEISKWKLFWPNEVYD